MLARVEAALREDERWDRLVELLLRRLDLQEDEDEQLAALREVARIFRERLAAPARALTPGIAMLRLRPTDDELWEDLRADAGAANEWEQLVSQASEIAQAAGPTPEAARIWRELARVLRENLDRPDDALAAYREALVADPGGSRDARRGGGSAAPARTMAGAGGRPARGLERGRRTGARCRAHAGGGRAVRDAAHRRRAARSPRTNRCWRSIPTRTAASRRARWSGCTRARSAGPIWRGCWNGARCSRAPADAFALRRRRAEILADDLDSLDEAAEELELLSADNPEIADRSLLDLLERVYQRAERHDDYLRTLQRQADAIADPVERLAILRRLAAEGEAQPDGLDRAAEALEQILRIEPRDADAFAALERIYRGADRPAALAAAMQRRLEVTETIEAQRELLSALAGSTNTSWTNGSRRSTPTAAPRWPATAAGDLRRHRPSGGAAGTLGRRGRGGAQVGRDRARERGRARGAGARAPPQRRAGGARWRCSSTPPNARRPAGAGRAADRGGPILQGGLGKENRQSEQDQEDQAVELYVRALAADPDHAPAAERLAEIYATRGRWADVEELLDVVIDGLDPGETDRLVALEMKLAEACVQLGKTDKNKMDKALDSLARAHEARAESLPVLHKYGDLRMQRHEWKDALTLYESILRDQRQTLSPSEAAEVAMQIGACHVGAG